MVLNRGLLPTALPEIENRDNGGDDFRQRYRAVHSARTIAERMRQSPG